MFWRVLLFAFVIALLTSCQPPINYNFTVASETQPFVAKFEKLCQVTSRSSIYLVDMPIQYFGVCANYSANNPFNYIEIDRHWWDASDEDAREELIFHELGHCVLNRRHDDNLFVMGIYINAPKSIMYYLPFGFADIYKNNKEYYYSELCNIVRI